MQQASLTVTLPTGIFLINPKPMTKDLPLFARSTDCNQQLNKKYQGTCRWGFLLFNPPVTTEEIT